MRRIFILAIIFFFQPTYLHAQGAGGETFTCKMGSNVRKIEVKSVLSDDGEGCEVVYTKETEAPGSSQSLWAAKKGSDYCIEKSNSFAEKLRGLGWTCVGDQTSATEGAVPSTGTDSKSKAN